MHFSMASEHMTDKVIGNQHGFAHLIHNVTSDYKFSSYLRFFSFYAHNNSKQLQSAHITTDERCHSLVVPKQNHYTTRDF